MGETGVRRQPKSEPQSQCTGSHQPVPERELNADDLCEICQALDRLRHTLEANGKVRMERETTMPYKDE